MGLHQFPQQFSISKVHRTWILDRTNTCIENSLFIFGTQCTYQFFELFCFFSRQVLWILNLPLSFLQSTPFSSTLTTGRSSSAIRACFSSAKPKSASAAINSPSVISCRSLGVILPLPGTHLAVFGVMQLILGLCLLFCCLLRPNSWLEQRLCLHQTILELFLLQSNEQRQ